MPRIIALTPGLFNTIVLLLESLLANLSNEYSDLLQIFQPTTELSAQFCLHDVHNVITYGILNQMVGLANS